MSYARRLAVVAACAFGLAAVPVAVADLSGDKAEVDSRIEELEAEIETAKQRAGVLTSDLAAASERIELVSDDIDVLATEVAELESELDSHRARLAELRDLYQTQTRHLELAESAERAAQERLQQRLVDLYTTEQLDEIAILLGAGSLNDAIEQLEYLAEIAERDQAIADQVATARHDVAAARRETAATKRSEAETTRALASRTAERQAALDDLLARQAELVAARTDRQDLLATVEAGRSAAQEDLEALEAVSAELAERIRAAQAAAVVPATSAGDAGSAAGGGGVSSSGFVWPVNGPLTSGFGQRWGRLHAGVDIAAGYGTPIAAAAAGTVIYAGGLGGYGNLVVVDHGGGLSTAYAHQQAIYVAVGQRVAQGETIGEVGNTGYSFGPHLHFEVRVNGSPVDPLGYL